MIYKSAFESKKGVTAVILLVLDTAYLSLNKKFLDSHMKKIQGEPMKIKTGSLIACYLIIIMGLYYFIILPKRSAWTAFLLGLFVYGVYETTNYSVLNRWPLELVVMDTVWGGVLFATTTLGVAFIGKYINGIKGNKN